MATQDKMVVGPRRCTSLPVFPLELWDMIIEYLRQEDSVQHLSRLAQTCSVLYSRIEPSLYQPVRLFNSESGARLAFTIEQRPDLAPLIREIRHREDTGLEWYSHRHFKFYEMAATLPNLEKLFLRGNPRPFDFEKWGNRDDRDKAVGEWARKISKGSCTIQEWRDLGWGPSGESSLSPPATDRRMSFMLTGAKDTLFLHAFLQNPPGLPALRVCHIGSEFDGDEKSLQMNSSCLPKLNEALFLHQGLIKLCVTGAMYRVSSCGYPMTGASTTQLEELTLLNCSMDTSDLAALMSYPKALKRFTFRGPRDEDLIDRVEEPWDYVDALIGAAQSLEYVDYDLYWGGEEDADFGELLNLKHLTTTISTLAGRECLELEPEFEVLPPSLESLIIRYDEVKAWLPSCIYELAKGEKLPNLRRFTCEIPEIIESLPSTNDLKVNPPATQICQEINTWQSKFAELNVELSAVTVPYPLEMPKYELCPCENLSFYHRMFYHMHDPLTVPWEDHEEDVFFGDWADIDDELDLDQIMDDLAESESSLTEGDFDDQ